MLNHLDHLKGIDKSIVEKVEKKIQKFILGVT